MMRKILIALSLMTLAVVGGRAALADRYPDINPNTHLHPTKNAKPVGGGGSNNLSYHNGSVIVSAKVVPIFWGTEWGTASSPSAIASHVKGFFGQFGTTSHYAVINQYYQVAGGKTSYIASGSLGTTAIFDGSNPPTNVTDADVQAEVYKYLGVSGGVPYDASTIYEVFLPSTSYSSNGSSDSCGGPNLSYCAYHGHFSSGSYSNIKYASMPYPSCGGCQSAGFTTAQNFDHFSSHETREAVTDEDGNAWYDRRGYEADDKCAWSPAPFIDSSSGTAYGYQYEWSNKAGGCVQ